MPQLTGCTKIVVSQAVALSLVSVRETLVSLLEILSVLFMLVFSHSKVWCNSSNSTLKWMRQF